MRVQDASGAGTEGDEGVLAPADTQAEEGDSTPQSRMMGGISSTGALTRRPAQSS